MGVELQKKCTRNIAEFLALHVTLYIRILNVLVLYSYYLNLEKNV